MKSSTLSIAEGKKHFSRLIQASMDNHEEVVITKRGKPVAVIVPYEEYRRSKRLEGYKKILEAREMFLRTGVMADDVYRQSRDELGKRT